MDRPLAARSRKSPVPACAERPGEGAPAIRALPFDSLLPRPRIAAPFSLVAGSGRPARIDRARLPAYVGTPAARWESGYPSDCKSAYTGSNPVRASKKNNDF